MAAGIIDLVFGALEVSLSWRCAVPTLVGLGVGLAYFYSSSQEPSAAAIAFGLAALGWFVGLFWHFAAAVSRR
jgi:hypothetical protein